MPDYTGERNNRQIYLILPVLPYVKLIPATGKGENNLTLWVYFILIVTIV